MTNALKSFRIFVGIGLVVNLVFALPALFTPRLLGMLINIGEVEQTVWLRNVGILLIILSSTYIPVFQDPIRYIFVSMIIVVGRFSAGIFFLVIALYANYPSGFGVIAGTDLILSTIQAFFLLRLLYGGEANAPLAARR